MTAEPQYRLVYEETLAAVARQCSEVEEVRGAAARALGIAALTATVTAALVSKSDATGDSTGLGPLAWLVISLVGVIAVVVAFIWWPRKGWRFDIDAATAISALVERTDDGVTSPLPMEKVYRERALNLKKDYDGNKELLDPLKMALRGVVVLVAGVVVFLLISVSV